MPQHHSASAYVRLVTFSLIVWQYITGWRKFDSAASRTSDRARCGPAAATPTRAVQSDHPPNRIIIILLRAFGTAESLELLFFESVGSIRSGSNRLRCGRGLLLALHYYQRCTAIIRIALARGQPVQGKAETIAAGPGRSDGREPSLEAARTRKANNPSTNQSRSAMQCRRTCRRFLMQ